jgi:hypothetical protein
LEIIKREKSKNQIIETQTIKYHCIQGLKFIEEALVPKIYLYDKSDKETLLKLKRLILLQNSFFLKKSIFVKRRFLVVLIPELKNSSENDNGIIVVNFS